MKILIASVILFSMISCAYSQTADLQSNEKISFPEMSLKDKLLSQSSDSDKVKVKTSSSGSKKSPALALLFSLVIPGAGQLYLNRFDVGQYFLGADVALWVGYIATNVYGNDVQTNARIFSQQHAEIQDINDKDDDYFGNVGNYNNIYEYNNAMLQRGEYKNVYNVDQYYWDWDNVDNRNIYESQRISSERIYNTRIFFGTLLIVNRIVSGISAYLIASNQGSKKKSAINITPEVLYKNNYSFDGLKINLSKNF